MTSFAWFWRPLLGSGDLCFVWPINISRAYRNAFHICVVKILLYTLSLNELKERDKKKNTWLSFLFSNPPDYKLLQVRVILYLISKTIRR